MMLQTNISGHVLTLGLPEWGHLRPLCAFACRAVLTSPDVTITLLTAGNLTLRVEREISRYFSSNEIDTRAKANIRIINLGGQGFVPFTLIPVIYAEFPSFYSKLLNGKPIKCHATDKTFEPLGRPNVVVLELFFLEVLRNIRSVTGNSIPVISWVSIYSLAMLRIMGPSRVGGLGGSGFEALNQAEKTGRNWKDILHELYHPSTGIVVNVPGLPPMYDYEMHCQEISPEFPLTEFWATGSSFLDECDGILSISNASFEPQCLDAMRTWFGETDRHVYAIGPLIPPGFGGEGPSDIAKQKEIEGSENGRDIQRFLDKISESKGERSLIYISFGSLWWPKWNQHVWLLVDLLMELGFPFILSHASPRSIVPPGYGDKIRQSGIGVLTSWSPQQTILSHPATGWILSHCGQNSITEALARGIPIIAWPLTSEQPLNAAYLTLVLDVAFEMVEVRTGDGLKPLFRGVRPTGTVEAVAAEARDVLQRARGPEGERKRRNAEFLRDKWNEKWKDGGEALKELRQFLSDQCGKTAAGASNNGCRSR